MQAFSIRESVWRVPYRHNRLDTKGDCADDTSAYREMLVNREGKLSSVWRYDNESFLRRRTLSFKPMLKFLLKLQMGRIVGMESSFGNHHHMSYPEDFKFRFSKCLTQIETACSLDLSEILVPLDVVFDILFVWESYGLYYRIFIISCLNIFFWYQSGKAWLRNMICFYVGQKVV